MCGDSKAPKRHVEEKALTSDHHHHHHHHHHIFVSFAN